MTTTTPPLARPSDPDTSHDSVPAREKRELQKLAILELLRAAPGTDHDLEARYAKQRLAKRWPATRSDSVRKRRSELKAEGRVYDTGMRDGLPGGRASVVWAAVEDAS